MGNDQEREQEKARLESIANCIQELRAELKTIADLEIFKLSHSNILQDQEKTRQALKIIFGEKNPEKNRVIGLKER